MPEYLALPAWDAPARTVDEWVAALAGSAGGPVALKRESPTVAWLEVGPSGVRGYMMIEDGHAAAINFEVPDADPEAATKALSAASAALGWELHPDEEGDEDEADDD